MNCAWLAVAAAFGAALGTLIVTGWLIWRDRSGDDDVDTDFLNDWEGTP